MRVHFSTDDLPPRDREQFWLDFVSKHVISVTPGDRPDPATFRAQLDAQVAGRFTWFDFRTTHRIDGRTAADVSRDNSDRFNLRRVSREQIYSAAPTRARAEEVRLAPGDFCITSVGWPNQSAMKDGVSFSALLIPHGVLSPLLAGGRLTRPIAVSAGSPLGSLLGVAFDTATTQLPHLSPELGDAVLQNLCGLVALACGASDEGRWSGQDALRAARLEGAKRHIDQHLAEPGLTPASAAAALGISLRHLHLLFEPTGTSFAQYVARRRLLQCRAVLASPSGTGRSVADIAFGWGFNSLATFYRAFQHEFGLPPAAVRAAGTAGHGG
jgi:AraC-like DNA-binding protein